MSEPDVDREDAEVLEQTPRPAPWAVAIAVLALLAFGVSLGSLAGSREEPPARVLLASSPPAPAGGAPTTTARPEASEADTESSEEGASEPEEREEGGDGEGGRASAAAPAAAQADEHASGASGEETGESRHGRKSTGERAGSEESPASAGTTPGSSEALPPIKHVFLIVLGDEGFQAGFGVKSTDTYLSSTLRREGELISNYYAVASGELANEIAMISGQGPTPQTDANCPTYEPLSPGTAGTEGQWLGAGCVYPSRAVTVANQLTASGRTWKAYVEGLSAANAARQPARPAASRSQACPHPMLGAPDSEATPTAAHPHVTWRDPFLYFQAVTDAPSCAKHLVDLATLSADLKRSATTPALSYIAPSPCADGAAEPCAPSEPAGGLTAESFLRRVVPEIEASAAYAEGGMIAITFDEAPQSGANADSSGCCLTMSYPNLSAGGATSSGTTTTTTSAADSSSSGPTSTTSSSVTASSTSSSSSSTSSTGLQSAATTSATTTLTSAAQTSALSGSTSMSPGGGRVGLLLLSKYVKPNSIEVDGEYDHFSLLLSIEALFHLHPLGYARAPGLLAFGRSVYNAYR